MKLKNRVALVTGASRGIGKGIALAYAREGADIIFTYHSNHKAAEETRLELEALGGRVMMSQTDSADEKAIIKLRDLVKERFGKLNILVNNAGTIGEELPCAEMPVEEFDRVLACDLRGVFMFCKYFIPLIAKNPVGKIINITSELGFKGRANYIPYVTAKTGLNGLSRCLAYELAPDILVNSIAPGPIETDMILADMDPVWLEKEKDIPLQRLGKVEEIAAAALLLASDEGNFFCGQIVSPNGGAVFT